MPFPDKTSHSEASHSLWTDNIKSMLCFQHPEPMALIPYCLRKQKSLLVRQMLMETRSCCWKEAASGRASKGLFSLGPHPTGAPLSQGVTTSAPAHARQPQRKALRLQKPSPPQPMTVRDSWVLAKESSPPPF